MEHIRKKPHYLYSIATAKTIKVNCIKVILINRLYFKIYFI